MNISYINILQTIESFASAHLQIKKFASDFPAQMPNFATKNEEYPILFVSPTTSIFQENTNRYEIDVYCFDIIQSDRENINTILSDTNLILNDLNRWMLDGDLFGIDNVSTSQCTPIDNSLLDYAAGWVMRMTFETDTYGVCEIPFSDSPVVITEVNNIVYSKYLTCETLSECPTIIDINNEISGLTESKFNNPTGTTNEYILGNGTLAPISGITSLVKNITPDTYLGLRLTPTDAANNGFYINKSVNGAVGFYTRNTDNSGNGAVSEVSVGGTGTLYQNYASLFHANDGYYIPYLRGKNGLTSNNDFFFVGWNSSSFDFRTGNGTYGTETSKFKISSGGTLTIGVQPSLDNAITDILGRKSDGSIVRVDKSSLGAVTSVGLTMPSAFSVSDSPIISAGTINVTATGTTNQFIKGDGTLGTTVTRTSELINDGDNGSTHFISLQDLPSNLILYATTAASDISGYSKLVTSLTDPSYNTGATDVSTGAITGTDQLISSLASPTNIIIGNPGVFNITTVGNIRRISGTGDATFYFQAYKRTSGGTETLVAISDNTLPIGNGTYAEFLAIGLWNDGVFLSTDRIVLKFYANRIAGGSNPTFEFQFGGSTPVRTFVPIPLNVTPGSSYIRRHSFTNYNPGTGNSLDYNGYAVQGSSESANVWTITRLTINAFGISTRAYATNVAWTDRATVTYTT